MRLNKKYSNNNLRLCPRVYSFKIQNTIFIRTKMDAVNRYLFTIYNINTCVSRFYFPVNDRDDTLIYHYLLRYMPQLQALFTEEVFREGLSRSKNI